MEKLKNYLTKKNLIVVGGLITILTMLALLSHSNSSEVVVSNNGWKLKTAKVDQNDDTLVKKTKAIDDSKKKLMADVKGEVICPGLYRFNKGDRVDDLIKKAGGLTADADSKYINLAAIVEDTMVIYIPKVGEIVDSNSLMGGSLTIEGSNNLGNLSQNGKININTATVNEFETLTGIGPSRAEAIIQKRKELGKFQSIEDLMQVTGIGEKMFEKIKDSIVVK